MKIKINIIILFLSVGCFLFGFFLAMPEKNNLCELGALNCVEFFSEKVAQPLILISLFLFLISLILLFTKPEVFKTWSKFAIFAIPLIALFIISTPVQCGGGYIGMCLNKEMASIFSSIGFFIISLLIIIFKSYFKKHHKIIIIKNK